MMIVMFLFWIALITLIGYLLYKFFKRTKSLTGSDRNSLDILKKRYARGEISESEFERRKHKLYEN